MPRPRSSRRARLQSASAPRKRVVSFSPARAVASARRMRSTGILRMSRLVADDLRMKGETPAHTGRGLGVQFGKVLVSSSRGRLGVLRYVLLERVDRVLVRAVRRDESESRGQ